MHYGNTGRTLRELDWEKYPLNLLVSFFYLKEYKEFPYSCIKPKRLMLDSGAYSAWKSNKTINMDALIKCSKLKHWTECVALDVIGDPKKSLENALYMKEQGSTAFPVFHYGEDYGLLKDYCSVFPKVGLSCLLGEPLKDSYKFLEECFKRQWPHAFHSFGWVLSQQKPHVVLRYPFHSADTSGWALKPSGYGEWKFFNTKGKFHGPTGSFNLLPEIEWYLELERECQHRWHKELSKLEYDTEIKVYT